MSTELRALVVDDEIDCATSLTALLQVYGCRTAAGFGGATGVCIAERFKPHLIFLDLELPDTSGCELLSEIKKLEGPASQALFVCLTGTSTEDAEARCREAGFDQFIRKPIRASQLRSILDEARAMGERTGTLSAGDAAAIEQRVSAWDYVA